MQVEGWGRYPRFESEILVPARPETLPQVVAGRPGLIGRGNGRAYGDAAIGERLTLSALKLDRMKSFDPETGRLTVEAGVLLADILAVFAPRGYFPPVVPGTKLVTVGGMVAADVHGKNHHRDGGFGDHVERLVLVLPSGERAICSANENGELFRATTGGMGLTGMIEEVTFRLRRIETGWIRQRTLVAENLAAALKALDDSNDVTYSVAWIDCLSTGNALGRSLVYVGEHATADEVAAARPQRVAWPERRKSRLAIPLSMPGWSLNKMSVAAFNELYYRRGLRTAGEAFLTHWDQYFFPLDGVSGWNRIYGPRGFFQHQCVIPPEGAHGVLSEMLERIIRSGKGSFLAVLKRLGPADGLISFPAPGYTLALDFRVTDDTFGLLDEIDRIVVAAGGRLYLAKDARQSRETFESGYPELDRFKELRGAIGATGHIASRLSGRLGL